MKKRKKQLENEKKKKCLSPFPFLEEKINSKRTSKKVNQQGARRGKRVVGDLKVYKLIKETLIIWSNNNVREPLIQEKMMEG